MSFERCIKKSGYFANYVTRLLPGLNIVFTCIGSVAKKVAALLGK